LHWLCVSLFGQHATPRRYAVRKIRQTYHHRRKPEWVKHDLVQMYRETRLSARKLADAFNWCHTATHGTTVGKTYVSQVIRDYLYKAARMSERTKRHVPVSPPRNDTWGMDMTGKGDTNDIVHAIFGVIDHGSRMALAMHPLPDRTALTLLKALIAVIEVCGKPRVIKTDNETCFTSRLFHFGLALLRIEHRRSRPGRPWENGRIERLFGTLKEKLDQLVICDLMGLQQALGEFQFWYNGVRTHQHLDGWTPWEMWHGVDPYRHSPKTITLFSAWDGLLMGYHMRR